MIRARDKEVVKDRIEDATFPQSDIHTHTRTIRKHNREINMNKTGSYVLEIIEVRNQHNM